MRFAVCLAVIALGAILTFGVRHDTSGVSVHAIGVILMVVGLVGFVLGYNLYKTRRRTDVIYRENGKTVLEPNSPSPDEPIDPMA